MASIPRPEGTWLQRHPRCHRTLYVVAAIITIPVLIVWIVAGARELRR